MGQIISGLAGPNGTMPGLVGQFDDSGNLIPGTGGLGNPNGPQIGVGIGSGGLPPADGSPGLGGKGPIAQIPIDMQGNLLPDGANPADAATGDTTFRPFPGQGTPGMGGKGPVSGAMLDPNGPQGNLPQPQTPNFVGVQQGGTPGRPVPAAPMTPRGPGFANPGAPGVNPQSPQDRPLTGNFQPNIGQPVAPARGLRPTAQAIREQAQAVAPVGNLSPQPLGRPPVTGTINKPNRGIGTHYGPLQRGAGRGGILR